MTRGALENSVTVLSAIGGSLNALIHIPALAEELGIPFSWDDISEITSKTPLLTDIVPNGNKTVIELYQAGGIPRLMKELEGLLDTDCMTVTSVTVGENLSEIKREENPTIRPIDSPLAPSDGIQVLYGNLAPDGALVKTSAVPEGERRFVGAARVFNNEDECYEAFHNNLIAEGDAVIIRYEGPKGGPGMKEMHRVTEIIKRIPNTAVITDGRFSGASGGLSVGYLCPEASDGGPIALLENGDRIVIDLYEGIISVDISEEELSARRAKWVPHKQSGVTKFLARYADSVKSTREGATLK
jgi:dihydroxy-acid dehydratase